MRRALIAANWKMHLGRRDDALRFVRRIRHSIGQIEGAEVVLCPPFTVLPELGEVLRRSAIALGAQNMHWSESGAFTGEIGPSMLSGLCRYVILGHSERRATGSADESDEAINRKVHSALGAGLVPIVCLGETRTQREDGETDAVLRRQVSAALAGLDGAEVGHCVLAYEPIWAIGSGRPATPVEANRTISLSLRGFLAHRFGEAVAREPRVLYGGSVDAGNIEAFMGMPEIDGALVGGASLDPGFVALVRRAAGTRRTAD
jgi:triosephosphate isomerase